MRRSKYYPKDIIRAWALAIKGEIDSIKTSEGEEVSHLETQLSEFVKKGGSLPLMTGEYIEIYDIPSIIFDLAVNESGKIELNSKIKSLSVTQQKLLEYIARDHKPALICETLNYSDTEFWEYRGKLMTKMNLNEDGLAQLRKDIVEIFTTYTEIRDRFLIYTDLILEKQKKRNNTKKWISSSFAISTFLLIFYFLIYPEFISQDFDKLFTYAAEKTDIEMSMDSTDLVDDMILESEIYTPDYHWLLALKALQEEDSDECRKQLKTIKKLDRDIYSDKAKYIVRRLK